jgi:Aspartyl/Asparaginyl beta-hydroxylase
MMFDYNFDVQQLKQEADTYYKKFKPQHHQICVTGITPASSPIEGTGSLYYNWIDADTKVKYDVPLQESQFTNFLDEFRGTYVEKVYNELGKNYKLGRLRFMYLRPKTCLSWHFDTTARIHVPIYTDHTMTAMVLEDQIIRMPADGSAYVVDTTKPHTAFNAWDQIRIHLVGVLL